MSSAATRLTASLAASMLGVAAAGVAAATTAPAERASHPPKVIQVSYDESNDGSSPRRSLFAFVRYSTHSVDFATRYRGRTARARARYRRNVTDTDIHGRRARHPWALVREGGGRRVLRLIHHSLKNRGFARVRTRARRGGLVDDVRVRIDVSKCAQDPPLYPLSCEVRP